MRMDEIGYNHKHDRAFYIDRPNGTGDWLMLIIKSPACFRINGEDIHTPANSYIIYTPEYPQYYYPDGDIYYDDWIHFGPDEDEIALMYELNIPLNKPIPVSDITDVSAIVRNMCYEQYSENKNRIQSVNLYFRLLLYKLNEKTLLRFDAARVSVGPYFEKLLWVRESIYRWPSRDYTIDDMAKELSLSRSRFQHLYSETFGVSVNKDLINSRIDKASELLKSSSLSINSIASTVGYSSIQYFTRQFKNELGITPAQYRNKHKEISENSSVDIGY